MNSTHTQTPFNGATTFPRIAGDSDESDNGLQPLQRGTDADNDRHVESDDPLRLAEDFLEANAKDAAGQILLRRYRQEWWRFTKSGYQQLDDETIRADVYQHLDRVWTTDKGNPKKLGTSAYLVSEVLKAATACGTLVNGAMPQWLDGRKGANPADIVAFQNGLVDTAAFRVGIRELIPPTPAWFSGVACPYNFNPDARCPQWKKFLGEVFPGDEDSVSLLQEWFGYQLVPDNKYEKLMMLVGPPRSGKGTTIEALTAMLGSEQIASTSFSKLAGRFGLHPLLGKLSAVMPDAHITRSTDSKAALEVLKNISGNDAQGVDRKGIHEMPRVHLPVRFTIAVNDLPELPDSAGAVKPRLLLLYFPVSFQGRENPNLKTQIAGEAAGICAWALEGLCRLREQGAFTVPEKTTAMVAEFDRLISPVRGFIHECCEVVEGSWVEKSVAFAAWKDYCSERGLDAGNNATFGKNLTAAEKSISTARLGTEGQRFWAYRGIRLCA